SSRSIGASEDPGATSPRASPPDAPPSCAWPAATAAPSRRQADPDTDPGSAPQLTRPWLLPMPYVYSLSCVDPTQITPRGCSRLPDAWAQSLRRRERDWAISVPPDTGTACS